MDLEATPEGMAMTNTELAEKMGIDKSHLRKLRKHHLYAGASKTPFGPPLGEDYDKKEQTNGVSFWLPPII